MQSQPNQYPSHRPRPQPTSVRPIVPRPLVSQQHPRSAQAQPQAPFEPTPIAPAANWRQRYRANLRDRKHHLALAPTTSLRRSPRPLPRSWRSLRCRKDRLPRWGSAAVFLSALAFAQGALMPKAPAPAIPSAGPPTTPPPAKPRSPYEQLHQTASELFATPDSVGAIALGVAEGTRTVDGGKTAIWQQHIDPGNGAINQGTFSWQLGAVSAEDADRQGLQRLQQVAIPNLIRQAQAAKMHLTPELLVQGVDLWNQAPAAGRDFLTHLQRCQTQRDRQTAITTDLILCARLAAFHNPQTGELEASGFDWNYTKLAADQKRRINAVQQVFEYYQSNRASVTASASP